GAEDAGIEQLLAGACERIGDRFGEQGDDAGAERAHAGAERDPGSPLRHATGCRQHDADDQPGFEHLAKDDDERAEHECYSAITTPLAVSAWNSPMNS